MIRAMPSAGTPIVPRMVASTMRPTPGVAGVPMEAPTVVRMSRIISGVAKSI